MEAPFGYAWRKESCYADKMDLLILTQGQRQVKSSAALHRAHWAYRVTPPAGTLTRLPRPTASGCSMWYNLDGLQAQQALGDGYRVVNLGLNGTVNSPVQMQILPGLPSSRSGMTATRSVP
mgnify:CR=1 FL=1